MNDQSNDSPDYIHGSSPDEQRRLSLLNDILNESCLKELLPRSSEKVLDLGSGLGQFSRLIAHNVGEGGSVVGIERDHNQIAQAKNLAEASDEQDLVDFREGDATDLPLSAAEWGAFDLVHARFLLEHVPGPERVIAQMARAVRPGGRVFVCDDDHGDFRPWPEPEGFQPLWHAYVQSYVTLGSDPYVGRRLVELLHEGGLTPVRNGRVFFGGCAGNERFEAIADNLIAALAGAKESLLAGGLLDQLAFDSGMDGLRRWKAHPSAALWYSACCAEGVAPE